MNRLGVSRLLITLSFAMMFLSSTLEQSSLKTILTVQFIGFILYAIAELIKKGKQR